MNENNDGMELDPAATAHKYHEDIIPQSSKFRYRKIILPRRCSMGLPKFNMLMKERACYTFKNEKEERTVSVLRENGTYPWIS